MKLADLSGQIFHRLTVLSRIENIKKRTAYLCKCQCGNIKPVLAENLRDGTTKSCGCLKFDSNSARAKKMYSKNIKYTPEIATARRVWRLYRDGISFEDFYKLSQQNCYYCGSNPSNKANDKKLDKKASQFAKDNGDFIYNGLDRIDSSEGHEIDNVVPCCIICNRAKNNMPYNDFMNWIRRLVEHQKPI